MTQLDADLIADRLLKVRPLDSDVDGWRVWGNVVKSLTPLSGNGTKSTMESFARENRFLRRSGYSA